MKMAVLPIFYDVKKVTLATRNWSQRALGTQKMA